MAGWTKFFRPVNSALPTQTSGLNPASNAVSKFSSWLPEFYQGPPNRLMRYMQYEQMDLDHEVAAALDTIADFSTHLDENSQLPFQIEYHEEASPSEKEILTRTLRNWCNLNDFQKRIFRIFRSTLMYGDQFFIRDPETYELYWVDPSTVEKVLVNESKGKEIEVYFVKDLDLNLQASVATNVTRKTEMGYNAQDTIFPNAPYTGQANYATGSASPRLSAQGGLDSTQQAFPVDAAHVVHLSLSEGMNNSWPFGISVLETVFKVYKQKELLEDSILIYRVHRAPERRIFKIDVGTMPPNKAAEYLNRVRYEVQQKRIPSRTGGGQSIIDSAYNPMCLSTSTRIPLLDGRTLSLAEIIEERNAGKENWVYSCDPITGKVVPGNITWAGITRRNAETIKLTLDNDETIICTPDHKIPVLGKGFVEAGKLTVNDPLISFETRQKSLSNDKQRSYEQVYDHELNDWVFTHRMVAEFFRDLGKHQTLVFDESLQNEEKNVVHHKDYNRYNNDPRNLQWMNAEDHIRYHSCVKKEYWATLTEEESNRIKDKIRTSLEKYREENREEFLKRYEDRDSSWIQQMREDDPKRFAEWREKLGISRSSYLQNNEQAKKMLIEQGKETLNKYRAFNQSLTFTQDMLTRLVEIVKEHDSNRVETIDLANQDEKLMNLLVESNPIDTKSTQNIKHEFTDSKLKKMYSVYGFKNWKDFKKKTGVYNHRIKSIEKAEQQDVGTITVDFEEKWHNYHTFALSAGIFVKNSMLEDYFFAVTADGRGSSVDTLPGGENLGQIDDLKYWNNKMMRGLGVPSGYLPTGPEDGSNTYNDGRVGAAFIQEFRFSRTCERYQRLLVDKLDTEFKLYLKYRGIEIDPAIFRIKFMEPQNFSDYRQLEIDGSRTSVFGQVKDIPFISKRFAMKRYLGLTEDEIAENERLWREEKGLKHLTQDEGAVADMRGVGITPPTGDFDMDMGDMEGEPEAGGMEGGMDIEPAPGGEEPPAQI